MECNFGDYSSFSEFKSNVKVKNASTASCSMQTREVVLKEFSIQTEPPTEAEVCSPSSFRHYIYSCRLRLTPKKLTNTKKHGLP